MHRAMEARVRRPGRVRTHTRADVDEGAEPAAVARGSDTKDAHAFGVPRWESTRKAPGIGHAAMAAVQCACDVSHGCSPWVLSGCVRACVRAGRWMSEVKTRRHAD